jgi:hypothetical protein
LLKGCNELLGDENPSPQQKKILNSQKSAK